MPFEKRFISAFDLDRTLLAVNCSFQFGKFLYSQQKLSLAKAFYLMSCYAGHTAGFINLSQLHHLNFNALFKEADSVACQALANRFLDEQLTQLIYKPVFDIYLKAKEIGHYTVILSSSPDFLVQAIADRFSMDTASATTYNIDPSGKFSSLGTIMNGDEKAAELQALANRLQVTKENIYAYSDSHLDLSFLEAAGHPVAVRPNNRLRKLSKIRGWEILS